MTRSWIHFTRGRFVRQARVGLGALREEHPSRHGFAGPVAMLYRTDGAERSRADRGRLSSMPDRQRRCRRSRYGRSAWRAADPAIKRYRGREGRLGSIPAPSEPGVRISRTRLSS